MIAVSPIKPVRIALINPRLSLTRRQRDCFNAIEQHIALFHQSPTSRELATAMGLKSHASVYNILVALRERGWITFLTGKQRSITVEPDPAATGYALPAALDAKLRTHCAATGENPADVVADAVALFFDEAEGSVAA